MMFVVVASAVAGSLLPLLLPVASHTHHNNDNNKQTHARLLHCRLWFTFVVVVKRAASMPLPQHHTSPSFEKREEKKGRIGRSIG